MNDIVNFVTQGNNEWTPAVVVGLIVFCMIFDSLMMLLGNVVKGVKK